MEQTVAKLLSLALGVITDRLITVISLVMTFVLATWIMNNPDYVRLATFSFFAVSVFLPCLFKERKREQTISKPMPPQGDDAF
jgi:hypothetical protein